MKFPTIWPPDCPPEDAVPAAGRVFRLVHGNPPHSADFITHFESGRLPKAPSCLRAGLSLFRELQDAVHQRLLFPRLGELIAQAVLKEADGKTKLTEGRLPSHTAWWSYEGVVRESLFSIATEETR